MGSACKSAWLHHRPRCNSEPATAQELVPAHRWRDCGNHGRDLLSREQIVASHGPCSPSTTSELQLGPGRTTADAAAHANGAAHRRHPANVRAAYRTTQLPALRRALKQVSLGDRGGT